MKIKKLIIVNSLVLILILISGCTTQQKNENDNDDISDEDGLIIFDYPPFDLEKIAFILPMGGMTGAHVTPIDHQYYVSYDFMKEYNESVDIDVYSPGDGVVKNIQHMNVATGDNPLSVDDFRITIQHSSTVSSIYIHIDRLSEKIAVFDPGLGNYTNVNVKVGAGELIGRFSGSVDYNIVDENVELDFINPESYISENWKIHCPDPFNYFNESIKNEMIKKCLRSQEPLGGKIDYDIDGKLVGNWFEKGTNGYAGVNQDRYWAGHLSIVYDSIDPYAVIISIGTFIENAEQFGVKGNSPDPSDISVDDGIVFYELVDFDYYKDDKRWDRASYVNGLKVQNEEHVNGVILLQLLEDRVLKVELFPEEMRKNVSGFTDNAKIYVR